MTKAARYAEMILLYAGLPALLWFMRAERPVIYQVLTAAAIAALFYLSYRPAFSWRGLWQGRGWDAADRRAAFWRFCLCVPLIAMASYFLVPERFMTFPFERPRLWLSVMLLYPVLSVIPQVVIFRAFFFERYGNLFASRLLWLVNGLCFGLAHAFYGNWIAPTGSFLAGVMLAYSFEQHRSVKWGVIEHAAYGCLAFTLGIGWFFFKHS